MSMRSLAAVALALGLGLGSAAAQTTPPPRNPVLGDPGAKTVQPPRPLHRRHAAAVAAARADKQQPGVENGNQPDRAAAGGGAH